MNILLLRAYPRKNGYTHTVTELFVKGLLEGGATIIDRDIASASIKHCLGCYKCWVATPGTCVISDDMTSLINDYLNADMIVFATPLNSFSVSSSLKTFLDRTLPLIKPEFEDAGQGRMRNALRFPDKWPKKCALIVVGAHTGQEIFTGVRSMISQYATTISMELCAELLRPESFLLPFTLAKPKTIKIIEAAFIRAGYELATEGRVSIETQNKAATPLSPDLAYFRKYSTIYGEHAVALGENATDLDLLCTKVTTDVRILMQEMARCTDPLATAKMKFVIHFDFSDKNLFFTIAVDHGVCTFFDEKKLEADLTVSSTSDVWAKVFMRQINMRDALVNKQIILNGDKFLFSRLDRYFPPPVM